MNISPKNAEPINVRVVMFGRILLVRWTAEMNLSSVDYASAEITKLRKAVSQPFLCIITVGVVRMPPLVLRDRLKAWNRELATQCEKLIFTFVAESAFNKLLRTFLEGFFFLSRTAEGFIDFAKTGEDAIRQVAPFAHEDAAELIKKARATGMIA